MTIPEMLLKRLRDQIARAERHAAGREWVAGYDCLLFGLHCAEGEADEPWTLLLIHHYQKALEEYCTRYGVRLDGGVR